MVVREVVGACGWRVRRRRDLLGWRNLDEIRTRRRRGGRRILRWWCGCGHEEFVNVKRRRLLLRIWRCHGEREGEELEREK